MTAAEIVTALKEATEFSPEPPRPLARELPPAEAFPIAAMDGVLGLAATAIHEATQAPLAICGQSVLAAATLAVQGHADVVLPTTGKPRPLSGFFFTVAESGERKSAVDALALAPIHGREADLRRAYDDEKFGFTITKDIWAIDRKRILAGKKPTEAKQAELQALGPEPLPPLTPLLTCPEPTFEGLCRLFVEGQPSLGLFSAEGGQFIGGHGMGAEHKLKTAAAMSGLWDGDPVKRVRAGDGIQVLPGRRVTMHLMAQPGVAAEMLADPIIQDQGLLSRILVAAPDSTAGTRFFKTLCPQGKQAIQEYNSRLSLLLQEPLPLIEGERNELTPRQINASPAAAKRLWDFSDHVEKLIAPGGEMEPIRGLANKLAEHACRLAAVLALVDNLQAGEVSENHMAAGIELSQYYAMEALRLFAAGALNKDIVLAQKLLGWLQSGWPEKFISPAEIYQRGPNAIRDAKTARRLIAILVDHGWLQSIDGTAEVGGVKRREVFRITGGKS